MAFSFIGWGNRNTCRKPQTCRKSLTNFITQCCIEYTSPWAGFELTTLVVIGTDCIGSYKSNYHTITTTTAPQNFSCLLITSWQGVLDTTSSIYVIKFVSDLRQIGDFLRILGFPPTIKLTATILLKVALNFINLNHFFLIHVTSSLGIVQTNLMQE